MKHITMLNEYVYSYLANSIFNNYINSFEETAKLMKLISQNIDIIYADNYDVNSLTEPIQYIENFREVTSRINENQKKRKKRGVYYTPSDLSDFITENTFLFKNTDLDEGIRKEIEDINLIDRISMLEKTVIDPTCGNSEFLISAFRFKIRLLKSINKNYKDDDILKILETIHGNDINYMATDISKVRLAMEVLSALNRPESIIEIMSILDRNFSNKDMINENNIENKIYDVVIGNPPYVEDRVSDIVPNEKFGNVFANVMINSLDLLAEGGRMGFVIPLSYVSTPRMEKLRDNIARVSNSEIIISYADRPDSLFSSIHQKLCIVFIEKGKCKNRNVYTSSYNYWYSNERERLFKETKVINNNFLEEKFYPKIGNKIEEKIYNKLTDRRRRSLKKYLEYDGPDGKSLYINMRATFWIKVFTDYSRSNEYKEFRCDPKHLDYLYCLINSSLFFLHWIIVSDCWHITNKELENLRIIYEEEYDKKLSLLARKLFNKLEDTKVFVGTVQTDYEYKHKECKDIIDEIDGVFAKIYKFTDEELDYIKNFAIKYREGRGA